MYKTNVFQITWEKPLSVRLSQFDQWVNKQKGEVVSISWNDSRTLAIVTFKEA